MSWWSRLYRKRDEVHAELSLLGCAVSMAMMIALVALIAWLARAPWVFGT